MNDLSVDQDLLSRYKRDRNRVVLAIVAGVLLAPAAVAGVCILSKGQPDIRFLLAVTIIAAAIGMSVALMMSTRVLKPLLNGAAGIRRFFVTNEIPALSEKRKDSGGVLIADSIQMMRKLQRTLSQLHQYDPLTALPNRVTLLRRLNEKMAESEFFSVAVLGMRNHEAVIAALGPEKSNQVMQSFANRLDHELADIFLYRLDHVNFAFVIDTEESGRSLTPRLESILASMPGRIVSGSRYADPEIVIGAALYPQDGEVPETLLNHALVAQVAAAKKGGSQYALHVKPAAQIHPDRENTEKGLRRALEKGEFLLHFQPVVDIRLEDVVAVEALIRWNDPTRGMVPPGQFIGIAEESGLIDQISMWVLYSACKQLRAWSNTVLAPVKISINLSARQLLNHDIVAEIAHALQVNRIDPSKLEIELTETAATNDKETTFRVLSELRELGVTVAIDDFGSGYAGTSYLQTLPFDLLKIDREFISSIDKSPKSRSMCKAMIDLTKGMNIEVLAEGVETAEEAAQLVSMGCSMFQGFYFARPTPPEGLEAVLLDKDLKQRIRQFYPLFNTVNPILLNEATN